MESGLFLHQAHYIGQSLGLDLDFPFPQRPPKSTIIDHGTLAVLHMVIYEVQAWSYLLYALKYISMSSCSSNLHCLLVHSLFELHGLSTLPLSSHQMKNPLEPGKRFVSCPSSLLTSDRERQELVWNVPVILHCVQKEMNNSHYWLKISPSLSQVAMFSS